MKTLKPMFFHLKRVLSLDNTFKLRQCSITVCNINCYLLVKTSKFAGLHYSGLQKNFKSLKLFNTVS